MSFKGGNNFATAKLLTPIVFTSFFVAVVFVVYFGTATKWTFRPAWTIDYVNPMAAAIRQGRLDIPDPAMTYDLAFYNRRWYMTWGVLAAIVHIPLQILAGGRYVPALYTSLFFGSLTVGIVWWLLERDWFPKTSTFGAFAFAGFYAFGTMQYYLSTVGSIWQVNQVVSTFFGVLGTAMIFKKKRSTRDYLFSSACYGVALLGRPIVGLMVVIPISLILSERRRKTIVAVLLLWLTAIGMLLAFNAVRFEDPFETGHRYLTEAPNLAAKRERYGMLSLAYVPTNAWHMLAAPPRFSWRNGPAVDIDLMGNSIFFLSPLLLFAFATLPIAKTKPVVKAAWLGIAVTAGASLLYYNTGWMQFGYRYALDFSFLLVLLVYFWFKGSVRWWMAPVFLYTFWVNYAGIRLLQ